ncbi:MAG: type II secretion system F family protein [Phycisphaerales bacterium]
MTRFSWTAVPLDSPGARAMSGREESMDEGTLRSALRSRGLLPLDVRPVSVLDALRSARAGDRVSRRDRVWFFSTLATLLGSSIPVAGALDTMRDLAGNKATRDAAASVSESLRRGRALSEAVAGVPDLATAQDIALLRSGEASGRLAHVIALIDRSIGAREKVRRTLVAKLSYPAVLLAAAVGVLWFLSVMVIPRFAEQLQAAGIELPVQTAITLRASGVLMWVAPIVVLGCVVALGTRRAWYTGRVKLAVARLTLRVPVVSTLVWHNQSAVMTDVLATMLDGGADVLAGLREAREVVGHEVIAERLARATEEVRAGRELGEALGHHAVLPPIPLALVRVGLKSGQLVDSLQSATERAMETQERLVQRLIAMLEPAIIVFMSVSVFWVMYSLISGMLAVGEVAG